MLIVNDLPLHLQLQRLIKLLNIIIWGLVALIKVTNFDSLKISAGSLDTTHSPKLNLFLLLLLLVFSIITFLIPIKNNIGFIIFIIIYVINFKVFIEIFYWILETPEGFINYTLFHITKLASYDTKVVEYIKYLT